MKPTQEQVIAWAREAGLRHPVMGEVSYSYFKLGTFAALAYEAGRKDESEACAQLLEGTNNDEYLDAVLHALASEIRARREQ